MTLADLLDKAQGVYLAVNSELIYAHKKWEEKRAHDNPDLKPDSEKSLNDWMSWAKLEIDNAEKVLYQFQGGKEASQKTGRDHIRKAIGHLVRALIFHGYYHRE